MSRLLNEHITLKYKRYAENIMKTLWDESDSLHLDETMSTNSVLSDDYTSGGIQDLQETIENENIEDGIESDSIEH